MTYTYNITGMHCQNCTVKVMNALSKTEGVQSVKVSLEPPRAEITMSEHITVVRLNSFLIPIGEYRLKELDGDMIKGKSSVLKTYFPLLIIFIIILAFTALGQIHHGEEHLANGKHEGFIDWQLAMSHFMAGFFIIFSAFKIFNLKGFAEAYSSYDILAAKIFSYGYIYPFIELSLGISYLFHAFPLATNMVTLLVMGISSIGVIKNLLRGNKIQCACLGTFFNLPLSNITLIEDLLMVAMSAIMLILLIQ